MCLFVCVCVSVVAVKSASFENEIVKQKSKVCSIWSTLFHIKRKQKGNRRILVEWIEGMPMPCNVSIVLKFIFQESSYVRCLSAPRTGSLSIPFPMCKKIKENNEMGFHLVVWSRQSVLKHVLCNAYVKRKYFGWKHWEREREIITQLATVCIM